LSNYKPSQSTDRNPQVLFLQERRHEVRTYADNVALPAFARRYCMLLSIDIFCPPGPQQQPCRNGFAAVEPCWNRQTDRRTDTVPFHRPHSAYHAGIATKPLSLNAMRLNGISVRLSARFINKLTSLLRRLSTRSHPHLMLRAGACSTAPAAIDRYLLRAGHSAANPPAVDGTDRRIDGRT